MRSKICTIITLFTWSANNLLIWNTQLVSRMTLEAGSNNIMRPEEGMRGSLLVQENDQGTTKESGRAGGCKGQVFYHTHMLFILIIATDLTVNCVTQLKLDTVEKLSSPIFCCLWVSQCVRHRCHPTKSPLFPIYTGIQALCCPNTIYKGIKALFWVTHSILGLVLTMFYIHIRKPCSGPNLCFNSPLGGQNSVKVAIIGWTGLPIFWYLRLTVQGILHIPCLFYI